MIDLHTHTLFSDGVLLPSELVYRAKFKGYKAIALTDHVDYSTYDYVIPRIIKVSKISIMMGKIIKIEWKIGLILARRQKVIKLLKCLKNIY